MPDFAPLLGMAMTGMIPTSFRFRSNLHTMLDASEAELQHLSCCQAAAMQLHVAGYTLHAPHPCTITCTPDTIDMTHLK